MALTAVGLLLGPLAGIASAHVSVVSPGATQGGYTKVTFRVPTESDTPTTKVEVAMPTDTPIASVRVQPKEGWSYQVITAAPATSLAGDDGAVTEIVSRVVWTATGDGIKPGEFDEFDISAGPLPDTDQVVFKVLQTYGGGDVVSWIEEPVAGAEEPEHPAPVLALAPAGADDTHMGTAMAAETAADGTTSNSAAAQATSTGTATTLAIIGVVLALIAVAGAAYAITRGRRTVG
ncbi:YcnI family protein [Nakamurella deserti]|uniref:YcnI family copper-binding membrane protein n=1 Tax=Nakamurella deserti TaxID=2164074 RepID=UPI001F0C9A0D|nr:YcnI family protein [Nakamurella deserti]